MAQASIFGWVKVKKVNKTNLTVRAPEFAYRFLADVPAFMLPDGREHPPIKKGDLLSENALPAEVWNVLLRNGAVEPVGVRPEWPGGR